MTDGAVTVTRMLEELRGRSGRGLLLTRNHLALADRLREETPGLDWTVLTKQDLRGWSAPRLLRTLRRHRWNVVVIEDAAVEVARRTDLYRMMLLAARAHERWLVASRDERSTARRLQAGRETRAAVRSLVAEAAAGLRAWTTADGLARQLRRERPKQPAYDPVPGRVAIIKTDFWFGVRAGGSISHTLGVLGGMRSLGLKPRVWTSSRLPTDTVEQTEVLPEARPALLEEAAMAAYNRTLIDAALPGLQAFRPAVIYQRHAVFSVAGLALAHRLGVPLVLEVNASEVWAREAWSRLYLSGLARKLERTALRGADRLVLISEPLRSTIADLGGDPGRMVVNPNGVDVDRFDPARDGAPVRDARGIPADAVVAGFLGTFTRWHGVLFLADALPALLQERPNLHILFLGDGDLRPEVERRLWDRPGGDRIHFTGLLDPGAIPEHLAACDILLSPHLPFEDGTEFFGSPTKLFEYMAAGRPVVASRLGQIGHVVEDGASGRLVPPGDADAFRDAVRALVDDPATRRRWGRRGRELAVEKYTWTANVRRALDGLVPLPDADSL